MGHQKEAKVQLQPSETDTGLGHHDADCAGRCRLSGLPLIHNISPPARPPLGAGCSTDDGQFPLRTRNLFAVGQETLASDGKQAPEAFALVRGGSEAVQKKRIRCSKSRPTLAPVRDHKTLRCALDRCQASGFAGQRYIFSRPTAPQTCYTSAPG